MSEKQSAITIQDAKGTLAIVFSEATTAPERIRCSTLASTAFGKSLSAAEYLEREEYLGNLPLARGAGWRVWSLRSANDPNLVFAMCKTLHRDLLVRDIDGIISQEQGYCICSVITDSRYRGRGLASVLLKNVAEWLDGPGNAKASMLYSDIGDFYVSKGWDVLDAFQSTLTVPPPIPRARVDGLPKTRLLTRDDLPNLCERDVESLKNDFHHSKPAAGTILVTVLPTSPTISWLQSRTDFMNAKSHGKVPETKGTICESADAWMYWYHDLRHNKLIVQRAKLPKPQGDTNVDVTRALVELLLDTLEEAAKWGLQKVVIWNPSPRLRDPLKHLEKQLEIDITTEKRESSEIPCLRWHGGQKLSTTVSPNEFYGWS
ncbi:hypothetical protein F4821DRAFT_164740 [Hypoxylon rubiginosum]|uniref:Uncharacterized protein n=1 Tax=Hypoxylon rubiginosum TaxID=110542 RepID=A0ACC0CWD6_9PEZI|nr:hypothetical protein F4821DRAFT_164740 [Hypoxylon rubiginosum]